VWDFPIDRLHTDENINAQRAYIDLNESLLQYRRALPTEPLVTSDPSTLPWPRPLAAQASTRSYMHPEHHDCLAKMDDSSPRNLEALDSVADCMLYPEILTAHRHGRVGQTELAKDKEVSQPRRTHRGNAPTRGRDPQAWSLQGVGFAVEGDQHRPAP